MSSLITKWRVAYVVILQNIEASGPQLASSLDLFGFVYTCSGLIKDIMIKLQKKWYLFAQRYCYKVKVHGSGANYPLGGNFCICSSFSTFLVCWCCFSQRAQSASRNEYKFCIFTSMLLLKLYNKDHSILLLAILIHKPLYYNFAKHSDSKHFINHLPCTW